MLQIAKKDDGYLDKNPKDGGWMYDEFSNFNPSLEKPAQVEPTLNPPPDFFLER